jgi:flagellar assembly protein FliH
LARKIFKATETKRVGSKVLITPPPIVLKPEEPEETARVVEEEEEAAGQAAARQVTVEEPGLSIEEKRDKLLDEAKLVKQEAEKEAERIKEEAEQAAFKVMQQKTVEAKKVVDEAKEEAARVVGEAEQKAGTIEEDTKKKAIAYIADAKKKAVSEGREDGFRKGEEEAGRLVERLHVLLNAAIDKRKQLIDSTERQLIDLVLLISKKVVKVISEKARGVVIANVREALKKVSSDTEVTIKVNTKDLEITTKHKNSFIEQIESLENVTVEEDSRVDPGGCIIETSFGDIDARIQKQLGMLEERIRELIPI